MSKVFDTQAEAEALMANLMDADKYRIRLTVKK